MRAGLLFLILLLPALLFAKNITKEDFKSVVESMEKEGLYKVSEHEIYEAAIEGVLNSFEVKSKKAEVLSPLQHRANELMAPRNSKEFESEIEGNVSGIGIGIQFDRSLGHQYPVVTNLVHGGGARSAGIVKDDQILKVNGKSVSHFKSFSDLVYGIRGPSGSKVKLHILRDGDVLIKNVERVNLDLAPFEIDDLDPSTIYVEVSLFSKRLTKKLQEVVLKAQKEKKSLILDLSRCRGGLFFEGLKAIELFAKRGDKILVTRDRRGRNKVFTAEKSGPGKDLDVILIVGDQTKSIAEAFAGSVRKLTGAMIVGQNTFGKGTMESLIKLKNGYSVKFTVGEMNLPGEDTWNKKGILPDIPLTETEEGKAVALQVVKRLLKGI